MMSESAFLGEQNQKMWHFKKNQNSHHCLNHLIFIFLSYAQRDSQ